jgi:hypothetical protein
MENGLDPCDIILDIDTLLRIERELYSPDDPRSRSSSTIRFDYHALDVRKAELNRDQTDRFQFFEWQFECRHDEILLTSGKFRVLQDVPTVWPEIEDGPTLAS